MNAVIPVLSVEARRHILSLPITKEQHEILYRTMDFRERVECSAPPGEEARGELSREDVENEGRLRVVAWNAARCADVDAFARVIGAQHVDVALMTEMDWGMARSGQHHTVRGLAGKLGFGYAFAVEFLELGLGDDREKQLFAGSENDVGYHGGAILSPFRILRAERIPLEASGGWFGEQKGQRRVGGRMAVAALLDVGGRKGPHAGTILFCAVHLESESTPDERAAEMRRLFDRIDAEYAGIPVVVGGDLNTFSVSKSELDDEAAMEGRLHEDPTRLVEPRAYEPLFEEAGKRGYNIDGCNVPRAATHRSTDSSHAAIEMKIDWFLTREVRTAAPTVVSVADGVHTATLSDHLPIAVSVT